MPRSSELVATANVNTLLRAESAPPMALEAGLKAPKSKLGVQPQGSRRIARRCVALDAAKFLHALSFDLVTDARAQAGRMLRTRTLASGATATRSRRLHRRRRNPPPTDRRRCGFPRRRAVRGVRPLRPESRTDRVDRAHARKVLDRFYQGAVSSAQVQAQNARERPWHRP